MSLDIKTSKASTQNIIENWIDNNNNFKEQTWRLNILSKRIISWISNSNLTMNESAQQYKQKFILSITKQINHLANNVDNLNDDEKKLICSASLILVGLVFKDYNNHYKLGLSIIQKFIKNNFDNYGFTKSRNPEELMICLKYFIIIKEWLKESQNQVPEYLEEIIYNSGKSYFFLTKSLTKLPLFNGSSEIENNQFKIYLKNLGYDFPGDTKERAGYVLFKDKKIVFIMDIGNSPEIKFSNKYQSGCLSFEITSNGEKFICNLGYALEKSYKTQLLSRSTAAHTTLYLNNNSSCFFKKGYLFESNKEKLLQKGLKILDKKITFEKNFENVIASHNGYKKTYGYIHERSIKFMKKEKTLLGKDSLIKNNGAADIPFGIRFHVYPGIKMVKTKNSQSVLLSLTNGDGWKFSCFNYEPTIEKGIFWGNMNKIKDNENIYISGMTNKINQTIEWSFKKVS
tara:strand:+ start:230 stop:1600 length:1371 start_codon:yes stop_codon:yes gene_type:complete